MKDISERPTGLFRLVKKSIFLPQNEEGVTIEIVTNVQRLWEIEMFEGFRSEWRDLQSVLE